MIDLYLKAPTEADMNAALVAAGIAVLAVDDAGGPAGQVQQGGVAVDHIGPFEKITGYNKKNEPITALFPDWHTNLRGFFTDEQLAILEPLRCSPKQPSRVFA